MSIRCLILPLAFVFCCTLVAGCSTRSGPEVAEDTRKYLFSVYQGKRPLVFFYDGPKEHVNEVFSFVEGIHGSLITKNKEAEFILKISPRIGYREYTSIKDPRCVASKKFWIDMIDARLTDGSDNVIMWGGGFYTPCKGIRAANVRAAFAIMQPNRNF